MAGPVSRSSMVATLFGFSVNLPHLIQFPLWAHSHNSLAPYRVQKWSEQHTTHSFDLLADHSVFLGRRFTATPSLDSRPPRPAIHAALYSRGLSGTSSRGSLADSPFRVSTCGRKRRKLDPSN